MFDFDSWARAYIRTVFGGDAEIQVRREGLVYVSWPLPLPDRANRRGAVFVRLEDYVVAQLREADGDRRAQIGVKTASFLARATSGYNPDNYVGDPLVIEVESHVTDR